MPRWQGWTLVRNMPSGFLYSMGQQRNSWQSVNLRVRRAVKWVWLAKDFLSSFRICAALKWCLIWCTGLLHCCSEQWLLVLDSSFYFFYLHLMELAGCWNCETGDKWQHSLVCEFETRELIYFSIESFFLEILIKLSEFEWTFTATRGRFCSPRAEQVEKMLIHRGRH